jgi:hypothetical protein
MAISRGVVDGAMAPFLRDPGLAVRRGPSALALARLCQRAQHGALRIIHQRNEYGALADGKGPVVLSWEVVDGKCTLQWHETLRTPRAAQALPGLDTTLVRNALPREDGVIVNYNVAPQAVSASFTWPVKA